MLGQHARASLVHGKKSPQYVSVDVLGITVLVHHSITVTTVQVYAWFMWQRNSTVLFTKYDLMSF